MFYPYVLSEIKPHLKPGSTGESLIIAVTRDSAFERDKDENFSIRFKTTRGSMNVVGTGNKQNDSGTDKSAPCLKCFKKYSQDWKVEWNPYNYPLYTKKT